MTSWTFDLLLTQLLCCIVFPVQNVNNTSHCMKKSFKECTVEVCIFQAANSTVESGNTPARGCSPRGSWVPGPWWEAVPVPSPWTLPLLPGELPQPQLSVRRSLLHIQIRRPPMCPSTAVWGSFWGSTWQLLPATTVASAVPLQGCPSHVSGVTARLARTCGRRWCCNRVKSGQLVQNAEASSV